MRLNFVLPSSRLKTAEMAALVDTAGEKLLRTFWAHFIPVAVSMIINDKFEEVLITCHTFTAIGTPHWSKVKRCNIPNTCECSNLVVTELPVTWKRKEKHLFETLSMFQAKHLGILHGADERPWQRIGKGARQSNWDSTNWKSTKTAWWSN